MNQASENVFEKLDINSKSIKFGPSHMCNLKCRYCTAICPESAKETLLSADDFKLLITTWKSLGRDKIYFGAGGYGEPLLCDYLEDLVSHSFSVGYKGVTVITNGLILKDRIKSLKDAGLNNITISLDTLRSDVYRSICGVDALDLVLENIEESSKSFERVKINMVVMRLINECEINSMLSYAKRLGCWLHLGELVTHDPSDIFFQDNYVSLDAWRNMLQEMCSSFEVQKTEKRYIYNIGRSRVQVRSTRMFPEWTITGDAPVVRPDGKIIFLNHDNVIFDMGKYTGGKSVEDMSVSLGQSYQRRLDAFKFDTLENVSKYGSYALAAW